MSRGSTGHRSSVLQLRNGNNIEVLQWILTPVTYHGSGRDPGGAVAAGVDT
jgi:hypothetical protein